MGLADTIFGSPGTTNFIKSGGSQASPGYNFAQQFYNWLPQLMQQQYPTYQGSLDPGMSPTMADAIRRAQGYAQSGPAEILQGVQGTLGNFMSPNFLNPYNSLRGGNPNYGEVNPMQRIYGGQPASSLGGFAGGSPGMGVPPGQMPPRPGIPPLGGGISYGGGQGGAVPPGGGGGMPGTPPLGGGYAPNPAPGGGFDAQNPNAPAPGGGFAPPPAPGGGSGMQQPGMGQFGQALGMNFNDAQGALSSMFRGNPSGLNSALAGQYGMNQFGQQNDGRGQFMHSTDHVSALQRTLGREPTFDEVQQSLRSGPGAIEQARSLFQQDDPNGRANWGSGQSAYGNLVDQYGLAKGGQMFEQQFGNGPMWAGGQPGSAPAPGAVPPLGGTARGPIMAPSTPATTPSNPMTGGVSATRPGAAPGTPGSIPPLGASGGGAAPTVMQGAPADPMNGTGTPRTTIPPLGGVTSTPGAIKPPPLGPVGTGQPIQRPGRPGRPGSTDQAPKPRPTRGPTDVGIAKPISGPPAATPTPRPDGPKFVAAEGPKPVFNPKTGNWHTPGAGERRRAGRIKNPIF